MGDHLAMTTELKPCPLCGGKPRLVDLAGWEIHCDCGLQLWHELPDKEPLIDRWNTRVGASLRDRAIAMIPGAAEVLSKQQGDKR
jgi:hypothetical protein